jgi:hypothetical protein
MADDDIQLWRINVIDEAFAKGEMTEDEVVEALLDTLELDQETRGDTQLEKRLRDFRANQAKMQSPFLAALLSGDVLFDRFRSWKEDEGAESPPELNEAEADVDPPAGNILTDSYDDEGDMLPPWYVFPDTPLSSMQWSLGLGASYLTVFGAWFQGLDMSKQQQYLQKYPVPEAFQEFYLLKGLL